MIEQRSPATSKRYTLSHICRVWRIARSSIYAKRSRLEKPAKRRGPLGAGSDEELISKIKTLLSETSFVGEGYRKVWARLRHQGIRTSKETIW